MDQKTVKANKDNDRKFLNGLPGYEKDDEQPIQESGNDGEEKLEYFTE